MTNPKLEFNRIDLEESGYSLNTGTFAMNKMETMQKNDTLL